MNKNNRLDELVNRLKQAEKELAQEIDRLVDDKKKRFHYSIRKGKVVFEKNIRKLQSKKRMGSWRYLVSAPLSFVVTAPVIYGMILPLALLDVTITLYQHICFRVYRIPRVKRSDYIVIDRHHLAYLNSIEKLNCVYCGYGNGLMSYAREITARTEQFWCPIKHARKARESHRRSDYFMDYGDAEAWRIKLKLLRENWAEEELVRIVGASSSEAPENTEEAKRPTTD